MIQLVEANWPLFVIALIVGLLIAWYIFVATRRTTVETDRTDVLDEGRGPAARNQALIDAPSAAAPSVVEPPASQRDNPLAGTQPATRETVAVQPTEVNPVAPTASPVMANTVRPVAPETAGTGDGDDLTRIKGVGPKLRTILAEHGVTQFQEIAQWTDADIDAIDAKLGKFQGRIRRDAWVPQAQMLQSGDTAGYESQFGKL